ncbi:hypothetical protein B0H10DRAFT_2184471 [Mycena sp. CBHHK59/15]|nr:hypothetical protein B0H10DRAFT_2184471 [Mycena sp. CBHHK59/15]
MFFFSFHQPPLALMCGGWNLSRHRMTIGTFYRWLDIVDDHYRDPNPQIQLRKVELTRFAVLRYLANPVLEEPLLPRTSQELLQPGAYAPFLNGEPYTGLTGNLFHRTTFQEREDLFERQAVSHQEPSMNLHNEMPQVIIDAVTRRDQGVCCVTNRADLPTRIIWAFPPSLAYESYPDRDVDVKGLHEAYKTVENAITLSEALIEPFAQNMFSVDVNEGRRSIITFQDIPGPQTLPSQLPRDSVSDRFWHLNFKWALSVHFLGGDPSMDWDQTASDLMEEIVEGGADLTEEKWCSPIGAEVVAEYMEDIFALEEPMDVSATFL